MNPDDKVLESFESVALEGLEKIRAFWRDKNDHANKGKAMEDARLATSAIGAYTRLRATMANEHAIELAFDKIGRNTRRGVKTINEVKRLKP